MKHLSNLNKSVPRFTRSYVTTQNIINFYKHNNKYNISDMHELLSSAAVLRKQIIIYNLLYYFVINNNVNRALIVLSISFPTEINVNVSIKYFMDFCFYFRLY